MAEHINGPLNFERLGKRGRPMVFVHPNPMDHSCWIYQMSHFSTWFRTIGIDLPGYGRSPTAEPGLTMQDVAQACWEAVDNVSDEPAILAGCSVGFTLALHMASQQPDRTSAIILSGCSYRPEGKPFTENRIASYTKEGIAFRQTHFRHGISRAFEASPLGGYFERLFLERNDTADVSSIIEMFRALGQPDPEEIFDPKAPALIITGSEDNSHDSSFRLRDRVGCELVTIEGAGHCCQLEQPWEWDRIALEFLRRKGLLPG